MWRGEKTKKEDYACIRTGREVMENTRKQTQSLSIHQPHSVKDRSMCHLHHQSVKFIMPRIRTQQQTRTEPRRNIRPIKRSTVCTKIHLIKNPTLVLPIPHKIRNNSPLPTSTSPKANIK